MEDIQDIFDDVREYNEKVFEQNESHKKIELQETTRKKNATNELEGSISLESDLPQDEQLPTKERIKALPRAK